MIYKINEIVRFKPADGAIWSIESPEQVINLTITNCNLLCLLLNKKGEVLSREQILEDIWDKQGLRSSNNTLNQYISILRRTFSLLGIDDEVIKTIPKVGFSLNASISVEKECNDEPVKAVEKEKSPKRNHNNYIYAVALSVMAVFIAALFTYVLYKNSAYSLDTSIVNIGKFDACNVNVLPEYTRGQSRELLESSAKLIALSKVRCIPERIFIVKPESRGSGRSFLAECIVDKRRNEYFFCKGYYIK